MEHVFVAKIQQQEVFWVVGLRWYAVVEADAKQRAQRLAQQRGAQSWVLSGQTMCSVGLGRQRIARKDRSAYIAGAAFFARIYAQQTVAAIIKLPTRYFWFVAAHKGQVLVRGDHCFECLEQAQEFMASVMTDYPQMIALNEQGAYLDWAFLFQKRPQVQSLLTAARLRPCQWRFRSWMLWGLCLLLVALGYYQWWWQSAAQSAVASSSVASDEQAHELPLLPAREMLKPVLMHFYQLPVARAGWQLIASQCDYVLAKQGWRCRAEYQRNGTGADAETFLQQQQWERWARAIDLHAVEIEFPVYAVDLHAQHQATVPTLFQHLSQLQKIQPAFGTLHYRHRQDSLSQWQGRTSLRLQGPLRSVPLLFDLRAHVLWYRVELRVQTHKQPDLKTSQLEVLLEGAVDDEKIH